MDLQTAHSLCIQAHALRRKLQEELKTLRGVSSVYPLGFAPECKDMNGALKYLEEAREDIGSLKEAIKKWKEFTLEARILEIVEDLGLSFKEEA